MFYTKPYFQPDTPDEVFELVDQVVLGTLVTATAKGVQVSHPVFMSDRKRNRLVSHVARGNEHTVQIEAGMPSTAIVMDPGAYISSSWYPAQPTRDSAPTWAFRVAHFHGRLEVLSEAETARHLSDLVRHMEDGRPDRWRMNELGPGGLERRLPNILGYELVIERVETRFKLGQDERTRDMAAAEAQLRLNGNAELAGRISHACGLNPGEDR
jgi:transcriptional regulator